MLLVELEAREEEETLKATMHDDEVAQLKQPYEDAELPKTRPTLVSEPE